ncbi:alpha/beta hydrolase [Limobrevibacterium gyesilva]|uniref:Alpha/beta fold hydrolase n=1 Tax=Limobrevibacterium gyesilva TaxID=2991712 RepID=A0AA41YK19_9PROT|nr:alpha/beta fold hydrolase [Limobrevibacterium gyesilva]MCW3473572.1 alpha/beta fold hydrolase [Limobrevibacterium gyesilva]
MSLVRMALNLLLGALALYVVLLVGLYALQRRIIFLPDRTRPDPVAAGVPEVRVVPIATADGLTLYAWTVPPAVPDGFVVLYLHGNGGNVGNRAGRIQRFMAAGWGVLMPEYRGYGGNPGSPSEAGLLEDARAAFATLRRMGVPPARTLLWGESLGTALAVRLATEADVAAVLLESPYTSMADLARLRYPFVPVDRLLKDRFESLSRIGAVRAPVLVMHGAHDTIVPPAMGRAMHAAAKGPAELWLAPDAGHNDLATFGAVEAAVGFVDRVTGR